MSIEASALQTLRRCLFRCALLLALPPTAAARAQRPRLDTERERGSTDTTTKWPSKFLINWNEYNFRFTTFVWGASLLTDYATYNQDSASAAQFDLERQGKIRDSRFLFSGTFNTKRTVVWQTGIMYDWPTYKWLIRQTQIVVAVPEIWGSIVVGRTKEGASLNRVMVGYDGWTSERFTFSDAAFPLLADGIKWLGYAPKVNLIWNLGAYMNSFSEGQTWSYYERQVVGRLAYLKMDSDTAGRLVHIGIGTHVGKPENDSLRLKSKPEVFAAPNFIDTGKFPATLGTISGVEAYYRSGPWLVGTEYYLEWVDSKQERDPFFHGGDIIASWNITGETRPYTTSGGYFQDVSPKRPVFKGGPGAVEAVLRVSYSDLDSRSLTGGKFWRVTPMINWYMNDHARWELAYGFSSLDRFGLRGTAEFLQLRLQLQFAKLGRSGD